MKQHISEETAFVQDDYPYSFSLRCKRRCWIEDGGPKKGFRFCAQTSNPKKNDIWNKPKKSTFCFLAMGMFLDEHGHLSHASLHEYSQVSDVLRFLQTHNYRAHYSTRFLESLGVKKRIAEYHIEKKKSLFTINGEARELSESDIADARNEALQWGKCIELFKSFSK